MGRRWADAVGGAEKMFREKKWEFRFFILCFGHLFVEVVFIPVL